MKKKLIREKRGDSLRRVVAAVSLAAMLSGCQYSRIEDGGRAFDDEPTLTLKEYEIACGAAGAVEVVIDLKTL